MADQHSTAEILRFKQKPTRVKLTLKRIKDIHPPAKGARYVYDTEQPKLAVRVTAAGTRTYVLSRRINGKPQRVTLGKVGDIALADARNATEGMNGDIAKGIDVVAKRKADRLRGASLNTLFDAWVSANSELRALKSEQGLWQREVAEGKAIGKRDAAKITTTMLRALADSIRKERPRTADRVLALLSRVYAQAVADDDSPITENPAKGIKREKTRTRRRTLKDYEIPLLIDAIEADPDPWRSYFLLLLFTGARLSAVASMRWSDLDLLGKEWVIPDWASKNKETLQIALVPQAIAILEALRPHREGEWVFPSATSSTGHIVTPTKPWIRICERAGVSNLHIHDLRRTVGTMLAGRGASSHQIAKALGHKSLASAAAYVHLATEQVSDQMAEGMADWKGTG